MMRNAHYLNGYGPPSCYTYPPHAYGCASGSLLGVPVGIDLIPPTPPTPQVVDHFKGASLGTSSREDTTARFKITDSFSAVLDSLHLLDEMRRDFENPADPLILQIMANLKLFLTKSKSYLEYLNQESDIEPSKTPSQLHFLKSYEDALFFVLYYLTLLPPKFLSTILGSKRETFAGTVMLTLGEPTLRQTLLQPRTRYLLCTLHKNYCEVRTNLAETNPYAPAAQKNGEPLYEWFLRLLTNPAPYPSKITLPVL